MIKKNNKKGFTIVELVIVIAVIAILAGVLIPTFSSIITKANESAALQEATNAVEVLLVEKNGQIPANTYVVYKKGDADAKWFKYNAGKLEAVATNAATYDANDEVYAKQAALDIIKNGESAITIGTTNNVTVKGAVLEDLSPNVEILIDVAN